MAEHRNSDWMARDEAWIQDLPLTRVAMPGSHDAGTWAIDASSSWCPARKEWWTPLAKLCKCVTARFSRTQNFPLKEQAMRGVRYFDLRACAVGAGSKRSFRFTHGLLGSDAVAGIRELCEFAAEHPREVLVLDVRFTRGFTPEDHETFQRYIAAAAGSRLAPAQLFQPENSLYTFWSANKNIVVIYAGTPRPEHGFWARDTISTKWPHTTNALVALQKLDQSMHYRDPGKNQLHCLQACLTPSNSYVLQHAAICHSSTQTLAAELNARLVSHMEQAGWRGRLNCIMVDVIEFPGLVDAIIAMNR